MAYTYIWDNNRPLDSGKIKQADDEIRRLRLEISERLGSVFTGIDTDPLTLKNGIITEAMLAAGLALPKFYRGEVFDGGVLSLAANGVHQVDINIPWEAAFPAQFYLNWRTSATPPALIYQIVAISAGSPGIDAVVRIYMTNHSSGAIAIPALTWIAYMTVPGAVVL